MRIGLLLALWSLAAVSLFGERANSADLIAMAHAMDGREVEFTGEAIGELMPRGSHAWLNLLDSEVAIGIWVDRADLPVIRYFGSASALGDTLRVRGTFHRSCPEHGGDMDIHAVTLEVVVRGELKRVPLQAGRMVMAAGLLLASAAAFLLWRAPQKRQEAR